MKRSISLILAILLLVTLTACQAATTTAGTSGAAGTTAASAAGTTAAAWKRDANLNEPGTLPICKQTVKLTIGMPQNAMVENFETNWQTQQLEKKGNFDLSFTMFAATEIEQKIDLMIVAGGSDLPDVIMNGLGGQANLVKYGKAGMIVATNDYYTHSAYWIKQSLAKIDLDTFKYVTSYDGKIYGLFALMQSLNNEYSTSRLNIYEPWLKALGLEMPDTTAEFVDVLRAFKTKDPNKNGKSDEIPLIGSKDVMTSNYASFMMTPFIYAQAPNFWTVANGKIGVAYNTEAWREGLRYTKQLLAENLLSPLSFTQDKAQMTATLSTDPASVGTFGEGHQADRICDRPAAGRPVEKSRSGLVAFVAVDQDGDHQELQDAGGGLHAWRPALQRRILGHQPLGRKGCRLESAGCRRQVGLRLPGLQGDHRTDHQLGHPAE